MIAIIRFLYNKIDLSVGNMGYCEADEWIYDFRWRISFFAWEPNLCTDMCITINDLTPSNEDDL
jgi:hypothetical protein